MRALELAYKQITAFGPCTVSTSDMENKAGQIVGWVNQTPPTGEEVRAYVEGNSDEVVGLRDSFVVRFGLSRWKASYVLARTVEAVLECRKARD
jgi:hypothetical protein